MVAEPPLMVPVGALLLEAPEDPDVPEAPLEVPDDVPELGRPDPEPADEPLVPELLPLVPELPDASVPEAPEAGEPESFFPALSFSLFFSLSFPGLALPSLSLSHPLWRPGFVSRRSCPRLR